MIHSKKHSLSLILAGTLVSLLSIQGCKKDVSVDNDTSGDKSTITFTVQNTADSRAAVDVSVGPNEAETRIDNVYVAAYSDGELKAFAKADETGAPYSYTADLDYEGIADLLVVANPTDELTKMINDPAASYEDVCSMVISKPLDGSTPFLMVTDKPSVIYAERGQTTDAGVIPVRRLAAKFLLFNRVNGLVITKVTMKNAAANAGLVVPFANDDKTEYIEETKAIAQGGPSAEPTATFYSYETTIPEDLVFEIEGTF